MAGIPGDLNAVEGALRQFDAIDQGSYAFRYATTPKGRPSLPDEFPEVNLRNLGEVVERIGTFLESCATALMEERDAAGY